MGPAVPSVVPPQSPLLALLACLAQGDAVLVRVCATRGSVPREVGAWMAVLADPQQPVIGTIGGGRLEYDALAQARALLSGQDLRQQIDYALGPSLGQCCGGSVQLALERVTAADCAALALRLAQPKAPVALFGGGHVGCALVSVLAPLPLELTWIDSRSRIFPSPLAALARCEQSEPVQDAVASLARGSRVLIMSFSHAEDLAIVVACLRRQRVQADLPFIGLIGSRSKWARFQARLRQQGFSEAELAQVTCPIGIAGIRDKRPEVIAVAVAAQLLQGLEAAPVAACAGVAAPAPAPCRTG